jgi:hypothetical protein
MIRIEWIFVQDADWVRESDVSKATGERSQTKLTRRHLDVTALRGRCTAVRVVKNNQRAMNCNREFI